MAKTELEAAQSKISQLKSQAVTFDIEGAQKTLKAVRSHAENAVSLMGDPIWRAAESVPAVGANLRAARELASVTDAVIEDVATPLLGVAGAMDPAAFAPKDGAINLDPLVQAVGPIHRANVGAQTALSSVDAIDTSGTIHQIVAAKKKVAGMLTDLAPLLETADSIVPLIPPALGSEGPRNYVVMFQNPAEARALGGTALSFAVIKVDGGRIELSKTIAAGFDNFTRHASSVIPVPDGADAVYPGGSFGTYIPNATVRPSFTTAAETTQAMWRLQFGYEVDGIFSIDPVALGYVLRATDPITLSTGDVLTHKSLVPLLLNDVYLRFNSGDPRADNAAQDKIFGEAVNSTFAQLSSGALDPKYLLAAVARGWEEHRVLFWSSHETERNQLVTFGLNGELPLSDAATDRVGIYFQDNVGSKLNYYLQQNVHLGTASCRDDGRQNYRVTVDLMNQAPLDSGSLPPSIVGNWESEGLSPGQQRMIVLLYAPPGSTVLGVSVNGTPTALEPLHDTDYPVGKVVVTIQPGQSAAVSYDFVAAEAGHKALEATVTPMVNATTVANQPLDCATVPAG
ncbi:MAG TPA: DUF4012 domain-containing protein [Glaciibacter sp.]|nr:DUF4012 domain-containing protein [Glaciibacter sp.]